MYTVRINTWCYGNRISMINTVTILHHVKPDIYIIITGSVCYCMDNDTPLTNYVTDQASCWGSCTNANPSNDICGNVGTAVFFDISKYLLIMITVAYLTWLC